MKTVKAIFTIFLLTAGSVVAQTKENVLFITSNPLGATIDLDGAVLKPKTPLIVRDLAAGEHKFSMVKTGYVDQSIQFVLQPGETKVLQLQLIDTGFNSRFPLEREIIIHGEQNRSTTNLFHLDQGRYQFSREADVLYIDPLFPQQRLIDALNIAVPIFFAFSGFLTAEAIADPPDSGSLPPTVWAAFGISTGLLGLDIALYFNKQKFERSFDYQQQVLTQSEQHAQELFEKAENSLNSGNLAQALTRFQEVHDFFPESVQTPFALYRIASIHLLQGQQERALDTFERIVEEYPLPDLYDRAQKNLADLKFSQDRYRESLAHLDSMVFLDPVFAREEIDLYRCEILEQFVDREPVELAALLDYLHLLVERYPQSENQPRYRYKLSLYLFEAGRVDEARTQLEGIGDSQDSRLQEQIRALRTRIDGA